MLKKKQKITKAPKIKKSKKPFFDKDFIDSLIEENPDIPNLKKYL